MTRTCMRACPTLGAIAVSVALLSTTAAPSWAGICFTSGKVYVQQKVWEKAGAFLECARREEPQNVQVYALLAVARAQLRQYASAGAAFHTGLKLAREKDDKKWIKDLENNRRAILSQLYNQGVAAMNRAGTITTDDTRTTEPGTPQAAVEQERGAPPDYCRLTENGRVHEFWYYPQAGVTVHFTPDGETNTETYRPFSADFDPQDAVTDTIEFSPYQGGSYTVEAAYSFNLASMIDPTAADVYQNLSYLYESLGRVDDAIRAASAGLKLKPENPKTVEALQRNLRASAMGRGNRLFNAQRYKEAIPAYWQALEYDSASAHLYIARVAESWSLFASGAQDKAAKAAAFDSAATSFMRVYGITSADDKRERENAAYNAVVSYTQIDSLKQASAILDMALPEFPKSKDLHLIAGEIKYNSGDHAGAVEAMRKAVAIDPAEPRAHQVLSASLVKLGKNDESYAEYILYKALNDGNQRKDAQLKIWVDSADNRLGAGNECKKTFAADGYPDDVYTFTDGDRRLETWFYWSKGKAVTFSEGRIHSKAAVPIVTAEK